MIFSSIPFLYYFLPSVLILYFAVPFKFKNFVLFFSSLFFYAWGEPKYVVLIAISITLSYVFGLLIDKYKNTKRSNIFLIISVTLSVASLAYFKYADFFISNFNKITGLSVSLLNIALPIGISFYTFQLISYVIDVYRGNVSPQKNYINLFAYIAMFPQLIAGPIVRYSDIEIQLTERKFESERITVGIRRFILGLGKKVLIANELGALCDTLFQIQDKSVLMYWIYAVSYTLHVYFDFSGYSDMAIGLGKILGFDFMENFNYPYISKSITEFWRRWHISLGSWFRDYVYIPLGGNRVSKFRLIFNILAVWMLTGFWHGADWNFILWGLYFAIFLIIEKFFLLKYLNKGKILNHVYVLFFVIVSFLLFNFTDLGVAAQYFKGMFGIGDIPIVTPETLYYLRSYIVVILIGVVGATPVVSNTVLKLQKNDKTKHIINLLEPVFLPVVLLIVTAYLVDGSFNPFLYFRF